jgi:hypothetical protein
VRKRIEGKDLAEFFGQKRSGRENGGMPEGLQEAVNTIVMDLKELALVSFR